MSYRERHPADEFLRAKLLLAKGPRRQNFIARKVFPSISISKLVGADELDPKDPALKGNGSGLVWVDNPNNAFSYPQRDLRIGPKDRRHEVKLGEDGTLPFHCENEGVFTEIPAAYERDRQTPTPTALRRVLALDNTLETRLEYQVAQSVENSFTTISWILIPGVDGLKLNESGAEDLKNLRIAHEYATDLNNGLRPDVLVIGELEARAMMKNDEVMGFIGDRSAGIAGGRVPVQEALLKSKISSELGGCRVEIGNGRGNMAAPGQTPDIQRMWSGMFFGYSDMVEGEKGLVRREPAILRAENNNALIEATVASGLIFDFFGTAAGAYPRDDGRVDILWAERSIDIVPVDSSLGLYMNNTLAP